MEAQINQVKYELSNMGLNEYQASALAHLIYLGETKATTISKSSGVPNARIYGILDELSQKGLIIIRPGRPALYAPLSPQEIGDALITTSRENIRRKLDDGYYGWEEIAPFDRIIITCAIDHVPPPLIKQLSIDGIIVAPIGPPSRQHIMQMRKIIDEENKLKLTRDDVYNGLSVSFIKFRDKEGKSYSE